MSVGQSTGNGPLYAAVGEALLRQIGAGNEPIWCYFEAGDGWVDLSVFVDHGDSAEWVDTNDAVFEAVVAAWEAEPKTQRWVGMEYAIESGRFTTRFTYPDEIDPEDSPSDRADALIAQHFGNKELRYPPL